MQQNTFFSLCEGGIQWVVQPHQLPHTDSIELSGLGVSLLVTYGAQADGTLIALPHIIYPTLRTIPNNTEATYQHDIPARPMVLVDGVPLEEQLTVAHYDGVLSLTSQAQSLSVCHSFYPAARSRQAFEQLTVTNNDTCAHRVAVALDCTPHYGRGAKGVYETTLRLCGEKQALLDPGQSMTCTVIFAGRIMGTRTPAAHPDRELTARRARVAKLCTSCHLTSSDPILDRFFTLCQLHAAETIFETAGGLMHSPGGTEYYCGLWTNDQVEYANPWFAMTGDDIAIRSAVNCYDLFGRFMSPLYTPIPTSIISEGMDVWEGAGDRGDAAMYLYGITRFLLTLGDPALGRRFLPAVRWCVEYCERHRNAKGVVCSDSDELEGRFPAGDANLSTNCLYYAGLVSAVCLAGELGDAALAERCKKTALHLQSCIESYFGARVSGFDTYRYYKGNRMLRSWICLPLCFGIESRRDETLRALFSDKLYREGGLVCQEGDGTYWDRATLYAFRAAFRCGCADEYFDRFHGYCENRLLGARAPYPIEAYPEGNMRHLSGESSLLLRVVTEGLLGLEPLGFRRFSLKVNLPQTLDFLHLDDIHAFGSVFSIHAAQTGCSVITEGRTVATFSCGDCVTVDLLGTSSPPQR